MTVVATVLQCSKCEQRVDGPPDTLGVRKIQSAGCSCGGKYREVGHRDDKVKQFGLECACGRTHLVDYADPSRLNYLLRTPCKCGGRFVLTEVLGTDPERRVVDRPHYKELYEDLLREMPDALDGTGRQGA